MKRSKEAQEKWKEAREERDKRTNLEIAADILHCRQNRLYSYSDCFRVDLDVPYRERHLAKRRGALWDYVRRVWYADSPGTLSNCERWHRISSA